VRGGEGDEEGGRMLIVEEGSAEVTLAGLEYLRRGTDRLLPTVAVEGVDAFRPVESMCVDEIADCPRLERNHAVERQPAGTERPLAHSHEPVLRLPRPEIGKLPILIVVA